MLPGLELMAACNDLAVPAQVMQHVAAVESSHNPYAIGVVGGRLQRQPRTLAEAVSTAQMLEQQGHNFSVGLVQVNRYNLARHGLADYTRAFAVCPNVQAGARILAECHARGGNDWGKALSCYYSGNFSTGYRHGYVQKVFASMARDTQALAAAGMDRHALHAIAAADDGAGAVLARRVSEAGQEAAASDARFQAGVMAAQRATLPTPPRTVPSGLEVARPLQVSVRGVPVAALQTGAASPASVPPSAVAAVPAGSAQAVHVPARDSALVF